jgi:hypothetical protein
MRIDKIQLSGSLLISSSLSRSPLRINDNYLYINPQGNIGIGTTNPTSKLVVTGSIAVQGQVRATTLSGSFTGSIKLPTIPLGTSETNIVLVNGGGGLVYRSNLSLTGAQGNQGPTGVQGTNGTVGTNGAQGNQGTAGTNGTQGNQGPQGNQGSTGIQGTVGTQGATGASAGITSYTNPADNRVITSVSSTTINAEENLTFDGSIFNVNTTSALKLPVGTTGERPGSPSNGMVRFNITSNCLEIYGNGIWNSFYCITFSVDYLVVAGGGAGGGISAFTNGGGGGGAGGYRTSTGTSGGGAPLAESTLALSPNTNYTVTVGGGGAGVTNNTGNNGSNSVFGSVTSIGGGGGGKEGINLSKGNNGGSGGGSATLTAGRQGLGTANQGFDGGGGGSTSGGGGGSASQTGRDGGGASGGNGGNGVASSITSSSVTRGGGGGGGRYTPNGGTSGLGGAGGGGAAADGLGAGNPGSVNTGGGGGGATSSTAASSFAGGSGGSGIVVISYPNTEPNLTLSVGIQYATSNGTVTTDIITAGQYAPSYTPTGFKVYEFRGTGGVPLNISW